MGKRIIINNDKGPFKLEPQNKNAWICQCGLSKNKPFCDGSHTRTIKEETGNTYYYTPLTQKRMNLSYSVTAELENHELENKKLIYDKNGNSIEKLNIDSPYYQDISNIRSCHKNANPRDLLDQWSDLYLMRKDNLPVATLRVTQARNSVLDVEDYYPAFLKNLTLRSQIISTNMLYKREDSNCTSQDIFLFFTEGWKDQYNNGMRVDLVNSTKRMIRYYQLLGYKIIGKEFIHPRTKKESQALVYIANINNPCRMTSALSEFLISNKSSKEEYEELKSLLKLRI